jgi:quercetin dioxygenase-like cupin family protein
VTRVSKEGRASSSEAIFIGAVETQMIEGASRDLRLIEVHFKDGARNKLHAHTTDQVLVITEGEGIVATRGERREVGPGDVAFIPAGEEHWHGAKPGKDMTHLAMNGATSKTDIKE